MFWRICSLLMGTFSACSICYTYSGLKKSNFVYFGHVWSYLQWSEKVQTFNVQMFQEFVHFFCVVFSHVVYHNYSVGKGLNLWYYWHVWPYLQLSGKGLNCYGFLHMVYRTYKWLKQVQICVFITNFNHTCSGLTKSLNFYWFSHLVYRIYSGQRRFKFVYLSNVRPYPQFSEKSNFYGFSASSLLCVQWLQKGLTLCILDMFDHTCSGQKKISNFYVQMVQEFVHYSCIVFCMWFNIHTVVGKGLNLCHFLHVWHTCSGLKKSKFSWVLHVVYCNYSGWKKV